MSESHQMAIDTVIILIFIILISIVRLLYHKLKISALPESAVVILLGVIVGLFVDLATQYDEERTILSFETETFFLLLLPPIIFEAGYHLQKGFFFHNMGTILLYAVIGTLLSTFLTGGAIYVLMDMGWINIELNIFEALAFGALISAVDPVAVLAIFEATHVNHTLNILVFGESVLNDAVSIVLYRLFVDLAETNEAVTVGLIATSVGKFLSVSFGGIGIGLVGGLLAAFCTKYTERSVILDTIFVFSFGYISYVVAEVASVSGIVAVLFAGMVMSKYVENNISYHSHITIEYSLKILASITETLIFALLGVTLAVEPGIIWNWNMNFWTLGLIFLIRGGVIALLSILANLGRIHRVTLKDQFIMTYGGLRGAIAFALAFSLADSFNYKQVIIGTSLFIVLFTVFVNGSTIRFVLKWLQIKKRDESTSIATEIFEKALPIATNVIKVLMGEKQHWYVDFWRFFEKKFINKIFVNLSTKEDDVIMHALDSLLYEEITRGVFQQEKETGKVSENATERVDKILDDIRDKSSRSKVYSFYNPKLGLEITPHELTQEQRKALDDPGKLLESKVEINDLELIDGSTQTLDYDSDINETLKTKTYQFRPKTPSIGLISGLLNNHIRQSDPYLHNPSTANTKYGASYRLLRSDKNQPTEQHRQDVIQDENVPE
eukprot:TRINITY_DN1606_c0_g1_i1.p1 TRINITY_DN1606_c0_g1~~TRINITY_DN1606_c0_g1_i1.p1  ORF type:complete len:667 (+),score=136.03 TRINITY_DN1606_c0_g1_i1:103-2103(+)